MISKLIVWWKARQLKRRWPVERQLHELQILVHMDHRWMAHDPVANALTHRYLKVLSEHWYKQPTEDVQKLRERLGLCPHAARRAKEAQVLPDLPSYVYGNECGVHERVYTERSIHVHGLACYEAGLKSK